MPENWNMPSGPSRRDTEDMLAHVSRSESETSDLSRRIEEQLRGVARRLDAAERSQSENNRAMSRAAADINISTREQSQAFDQLGTHVIGLNDRLDRVERHAGDTSMKDAVKGLHQGLSRLADQISQTANQSATQVTALANNLEQLAARLNQTRQDTENVSRSLDLRLAAVEKIAETNAHTLERAIEAFEERGRNRAAEQSATTGAIAKLEENIGALEGRLGTDPSLDRRLNGIEQTLSDIVSRLDAEHSNNPVEDTIRRLSQRLESVEKNHGEDVNELRAAVTQASSRLAVVETHSTPFSGAAAAPHFEPPPAAFEAPPFPDAAPILPPFEQAHDPFAQPPFEPGDFGADNAFPPLVSDPFAAPPAATSSVDSYLASARRSARAAAATADAERMRGPLGGFNWSGGAPAAPAKGKSGRARFTVVFLGALVAVLVVAMVVGLVLKPATQSSTPDMGSAFGAKPNTGKTAPDATMPPLGALKPVPAPGTKLAPTQPRDVKPAPIHPIPAPSAAATTQVPAPSASATPAQPQAQQPPKPQAAQSPATALDRLTALAKNGDPTAETIVGYRYRDGDGVPANKAQAATWLERAAEQGQAVAQTALAKLYEDGEGVPKDAVKAVRWYQAAAAQGSRIAMYNLALTFYYGSGQKKDLAEAVRWFLKAASFGLVDAQVNLAMLYEHGEGVPQSLLDAYKWYLIAANGGDADSKKTSDTLKTQLNADDRAAAERSAASFRATTPNPKANKIPELSDLPK